MTSGTLPPIESVSGGSHGVEAGYEQMLALAERYERQAGDFVEMAGLGARIMANGDLLESAILSPVSFGDAEVQVLDATTGRRRPDGPGHRHRGRRARRTSRGGGVQGQRLAVHGTPWRCSTTRSGKLLLAGTIVALPTLLAAGGISLRLLLHALAGGAGGAQGAARRGPRPAPPRPPRARAAPHQRRGRAAPVARARARPAQPRRRPDRPGDHQRRGPAAGAPARQRHRLRRSTSWPTSSAALNQGRPPRSPRGPDAAAQRRPTLDRPDRPRPARRHPDPSMSTTARSGSSSTSPAPTT